MIGTNSIREIQAALRNKTISVEEIVRDCFRRLHTADPKVNAFISHDESRSIEEAREWDRRIARGDALGPLCGVPMAVKDNHCTKFGTTTCGSRILASYQSPYDAFVVERLHGAGAIIVGKTNLDEFAMGSSTENSAFFPTRNPWNAQRVAGGSSGGSAAAVAADIVVASLGSDTGGSIRYPASHCGVVGLKPTYGRVSRYGLVAFGSSLDQIGPFARTVEDAAKVLTVIAGHDPRDATSLSNPVPDFQQSLNRPLRGLRIGMSDEYFGEGLDPQVRSCVMSAIQELQKAGAKTVSIHLPHMKYAIAAYYLVATAEASSNLARFDGVHYGHRTSKPLTMEELYSKSRGEGFGSEVKRRIMLGTYALSSGYYDAYYLKAMKVRTLIRRDFDAAFEHVDLIASPVSPTTAFNLGEKSQDPLAMYLSDIYTVSINLAGIAAISIPCGFDGMGLPIGLQLIAPALGEETMLGAAHQYQILTDFHQRHAPLSAA